MAKREPFDLTGPTNINLLEACTIGVVAAIGAVLLKDGVGFLGAWRIVGVDYANANWGQWHFLFLPAVGLLGGAIAGALIQFVAPEATGSGIPQVKAAIMGVPQDLGLRTAVVKLISCVVALGSGLSMGREGPTVQLSAALSAKASELIRSSPKHRAQLIAAGAGAGLAAAFNAPLAGALFVLEELIGRISGFTVGTAVVACFMAAVLSRLVGVHSLDIEMGKLNGLSTFFPIDIPFYVLLGVAAGVVGAIFNKAIIGGLTFNRDFLKWPVTVTCGLAGLLSGVLVASVPPLYNDYSGLREALVAGNLGLNAIVLALVLQFVLTIVAYSSGAPGGLFAPSLTMGACLGLLVAFVEQQFCGSANSVAFAIVGMGAVFCAVARVPMTAVVIIFEMTTDFNVVLPLMICSVVSYLVAEKLDPGSIYDQLLEWGGIDSESLESKPSIMTTMTAGQIMKHPVETIEELASLAQIRSQFAVSRHHGFPVLDQEKNIVGMLTEHDLLTFKQEQEQEEYITAQKIMVPNPVTIDAEQSLAEAVLLFDNYKISRIPVVENGRLVGIVTREDVATAESSTLPGGADKSRRDPKVASFVTYETRALSESKSRVLVILQEDSEVNRRSLVSLAAIIAKKKALDLECLHVQANTKSDNDHRILVQQAEAVARELVVTVHTSVRLAKHQATAVGEIIDRRPIEMVVLALNSATDLIELELIVEQTTCPILASSSSYLGNARTIVLSTVGLDQEQTADAHATGELFRQSSGAKDATLKVIAVESEKTSKIIEQFSPRDRSADELAILALSRQNFLALIKNAEVRELLKCQVPIIFSVSQ